MAVIRDIMPAFELFQPATVEDALELLDRYGSKAWIMAGGLDSFDWLKDRIKKPSVLVDLSQIKELVGVRPLNGGVEIGAMTTLTEVVHNSLIKEKFGILSTGAEAAASPQIRNQGTIGGNVSQDARCWYYRSGWKCYRAGGNICFADTPTAINREHAILGADRCVAVNPSDSAPALIALDAQMVIRSRRGERVVNAEDFFIGPGTDITRMTVLQPGELLTAIRIPSTWAGANFYFEKIRDRPVWDFPLVNIAAATVVSGDKIERIRIAVNGVAAHPLRLTNVEAAIQGKSRDEATADMAGKMAVEGAEPLKHNAYKVPLMRNLVKRAIRGVPGAEGSAQSSKA
jgi:xanthine dehydrogenase YagS FAD-binding subunit